MDFDAVLLPPRRAASHASQASMPSPVRADNCSTSIAGFTRRA